MDEGTLTFGDFELDVARCELRRHGRRVGLERIPMDLLLLLVQHRGTLVTREAIVERLWGKDTFVDTENNINAAIRKIRQALKDSPDQPIYLRTITGRGYCFIGPVIHLESSQQKADVAAYNATPDKAQSSDERVENPAHRRYSAGVLRRAIIALLIIVLLVFVAFELIYHLRPMPDRIQSIAVLPLENLSGDPSQEYFADGMTDELITELAKIGSLRVVSRTSAMHYKNSTKPLPVIARELGVAAIVEGAVVRANRKIRITAQLIRARDDRHLWSEEYERNLSDVLILQGEVAETIARQIQIRVTPEERTNITRRPAVNPDAHAAYLKGSYFMNRGTERLDKSIDYFTQAAVLDPGYAQAYGGLAEAYVYLGIFGLRPPGEVFPKAKRAARKALQLDDSIAEAHNALADVYKDYDWDWTAAQAEYTRALALNPGSSLTHAWYSDFLSKIGRPEKAIAEQRRALELDPVSAARTAALGMMLYRARKYDEAIATCHEALELDANYPNTYWFLGLALEQKREFAEAIAGLRKAASLSDAPLYRAALGQAFAVAGQKAKALSILDELRTLSKQNYVSPVDFAIVYVGLGDEGSAFRWLEKAYQERTMRIQELPQPHFDGLHSNPRFWDLMRRIGLSSYTPGPDGTIGPALRGWSPTSEK